MLCALRKTAGCHCRAFDANVITSLWVTMNGIAQVVGCLLMYGIGKNTSLVLAPWRVLFVVCGALTSVAGLAFYFHVPNGPNDAVNDFPVLDTVPALT